MLLSNVKSDSLTANLLLLEREWVEIKQRFIFLVGNSGPFTCTPRAPLEMILIPCPTTPCRCWPLWNSFKEGWLRGLAACLCWPLPKCCSLPSPCILQIAYTSPPPPMSKLSSALASECIKDVHEPSVWAELASYNSLTTPLNDIKGFLLLFDPPMLIAFIHIFSFMYSSLISISLLWQIKIRLCVNVCKKEALILLISFISLREKISTVCKSSLYEKLILSHHSAIGQLYYCSCGTQMLLEDNVWGLEPASPK